VPQTVHQICKSSVVKLELSGRQFESILPKIDLGAIPETFVGYVVRTPELLDVVLESGKRSVVINFVNAKFVPAIPVVYFSRFSKSFVGILEENALGTLQAEQLALIPASAFTGFSAKQWARVSATSLSALSRQQAAMLPLACWEETTIEQINNFGPSPTKFNAMGVKKQNVLDRRQFKDQHPCNAWEDVKTKVCEKKTTAFSERCKDIKDFEVTSGSNARAIVSTSMLVAAAAIPLLI